MSTFMPKADEIERKWYVIDAAGKPQLVVQYVPEEERPEDSETSNNSVVGE